MARACRKCAANFLRVSRDARRAPVARFSRRRKLAKRRFRERQSGRDEHFARPHRHGHLAFSGTVASVVTSPLPISSASAACTARRISSGSSGCISGRCGKAREHKRENTDDVQSRPGVFEKYSKTMETVASPFDWRSDSASRNSDRARGTAKRIPTGLLHANPHGAHDQFHVRTRYVRRGKLKFLRQVGLALQVTPGLLG